MTMRKGRPYDPAWDLWRPARRWPGILLSGLVLASLGGLLAYRFTSNTSIKAPVVTPSAQDPLRPAYLPPVTPGTPDYQSFHGNKSQNYIPVHANGHLMVWYLECQCRANFGVLVHNAAGALVDIPVNGVGTVLLAAPAQYAAGNYTFNVIADGRWKAALINPLGLSTQATPFSYLSAGQSVLGPFAGPTAHLTIGYMGTIGTRMIVTASDGSIGKPRLLVFDVTGFVKKLTLTDLPPRYWLIMNGTGFWDLKVLP